jgi:Flp pilus assembly protein TadD
MLDIKKSKYHYALITLLCSLAYLNSLSASFHFDDNYVILKNNLVKDIHKLPQLLSDIFHRPLLKATFALNYYFGGENVLGYHIVNILLHILVSTEVYILARELSRKLLNEDQHYWFPLLTSLLFALHPLHTGSVTYIASRSSVMATAFYLLSFILFLRSEQPDRRGIYSLLATAVFVIALGVKETVVSLPFVTVMYIFISQGNLKASFRRYAPSVIPLLTVLGLYITARHLFLTGIVPVDRRIYEGLLPPYQYFLTELNVVVYYYLKWLLLPVGGPNVDPDIPAKTSIFEPSTLSALVIVVGLLALALIIRRRWPLLSFSILWYFITLAPTSSIFPLGDLAVERRVYLPSVGVFLIVGMLLERGKRWLSARTIVAIYSLLFLLMGYLTIERNTVWKTEVTLWEDAARKSPNKVRVLNNRAYAYLQKGDLDTAERLFSELVSRFPEYPYGHNNLGTVYQMKGKIKEAIEEFRRAVILRPANPLFRIKLGLAYEKAGLLEKATEEFEVVLKLLPSEPRAYTLLASNLAKRGLYDRAIKLAKQAIEIEPSNALAYYILGYCNEMKGLFEEAVKNYKKALSLRPGWSLPHQRLIGIYKKQSLF